MLGNNLLDVKAGEIILIGSIASAFGVKGWSKITSYLDPPSNIKQYKNLIIPHPDGYESILIENYQVNGKQIIAKLSGINDRDEASSFTNIELYTSKNNLPKIQTGQSYYWHELEAMEVYRESDSFFFGRLGHLMETGAHDVMVITNNNKEVLIPFVLDLIVKHVDLEARRILVEWQDDSYDQ